jgi:hypothetical protein
MTQVCHNVIEYLQPHQKRNPGGDCFACATTAIIKHLFPEKEVDFDKIWSAWKCAQDTKGNKVLSNTWHGLQQVFPALSWDDQYGGPFKTEQRIFFPYPRFDFRNYSCTFGVSASLNNLQEQEWAYGVEAYLAAGWIGMVEINMHGIEETKWNQMSHSDHFVVIDGQRHFWHYTDHEYDGKKSWSGTLKHETHVVCSAKGPYWISTRELLAKHGAGAVYFVRRDQRLVRDERSPEFTPRFDTDENRV